MDIPYRQHAERLAHMYFSRDGTYKKYIDEVGKVNPRVAREEVGRKRRATEDLGMGLPMQPGFDTPEKLADHLEILLKNDENRFSSIPGSGFYRLLGTPPKERGEIVSDGTIATFLGIVVTGTAIVGNASRPAIIFGILTLLAGSATFALGDGILYNRRSIRDE